MSFSQSDRPVDLIKMTKYAQLHDLENEPLVSKQRLLDLENPPIDHNINQYKRKRNFLLIAIGAVVVLGIIVVLSLLLSGPSKSHDDQQPQPPDDKKRHVLLISMDGFRPEYLQRNMTPNLLRFASTGVMAEGMRPQFPSKTFPNHYTLVTGLFPENHGIVGNYFYDPVLNESFAFWLNSSLDPVFWQGQPIWNTVSFQGKKSAVCFWPGSESPINGKHPDIWLPYEKAANMTVLDRVNLALEWLSSEQPPDFASVYFDLVDKKGHAYGPDSSEVNAAIIEVDHAISKLMNGLARIDMRDSVNVIIVSDHGMTALNTSKLIPLHKIIDINTVNVYEGTPFIHIWPRNESQIYELYSVLKEASHNYNYSVFLKENLPPKFHYAQSPRVAPILLLTDEPYSFITQDNETVLKGTHGFDPNQYSDMNAVFMASGPNFKKQDALIPVFENYEVYNILSYLLDVVPAPNNGTSPVLSLFDNILTKY